MASQDWMEKDFYKALGVSKEATDEEIKKAYRKLARQYHPDRNPGDKAAEDRFKEVGEAYQVLSNEADRKEYDAIRAFGAGGPRFTAGSGSSAEFEDMFASMFGGTQFSGSEGSGFRAGSSGGFEDILGMFGSGGGRSGRVGGVRPPPPTGPPAGGPGRRVAPLRKAASGTTVKVTTARGKSVTAKIPAGVTDGQKIRIPGKGGEGLNGGPDGDIIVTVNVEKHPVYELRGKDVYADVPVSFPEASLGATIEVPTLDGKTVKVKVPEGSSTGKLLRIRGKGVGTGDMYVRLKVAVPKRLSDEAKRAVELFASATSDADPRGEFAKMARN